MPDIRLGDYTGHLFAELVRAREMADAYSRALAQRYADDPVLRHFSVPRYLVPKMELTVPVVMSKVSLSQSARFDFPVEEFAAALQSRADDVRSTVELMRARQSSRLPPRLDPSMLTSATVERLALHFHEELAKNADPLHPHGVVKKWWVQVFRACLEEAGLLDFYEQAEPSQGLLERTTQEMIDLVLSRTAIDRSSIENVLVDPETNLVELGSSADSVFTIRAELHEEAFFLRWVRDERTEELTPVVEFQ